MATTTAIGVSLETGCAWDMCRQFSRSLFEQMDSGRYDVMSLMPMPADGASWRAEHRTARKRADRSNRRGYRAQRIFRERFSDDIHAINTSATHRQGRPMSSGYLERTEYSPLPEYPCRRHGIRDYGVVGPDGHLVAYLFLYRCGDLSLVSQILGHAEHLENEVMYLLWQIMVGTESLIDRDSYVIYNRWDSGRDGLRFYKERVGLREQQVAWLP